MEKASRLQCNALRERQKSRERKNNGKQWKSNAQSNGNSRKSLRVLTSGCDAARRPTAQRASCCPSGPGLLAGWRVSLGAKFPD
jgi:hypothetical protein